MSQIDIRAKKIEEILNNPKCRTTSDFYSVVQYLSSSNNIDFDDYYYLIHITMYLFHQNFDLQTIIDNDLNKNILKTKINFNAPKDINFDNFEKELDKLAEIKNNTNETGYESDIWPTYYDILVQIFGREFLDYGSTFFKIYSNKITQNKNTNKQIGKIYLSISSKDLFKFARILLLKCLNNYEIPDFSFKIHNHGTKHERLDSICIYFTEENFHKYIRLIQEIKDENPEIQFNTPNFLAYQYNEYIAVAKDPTIGDTIGTYVYKGKTYIEKKSFTDLANEAITLSQKNTKNNHELALKASELIEKYLEQTGIIKLCEDTKKRLSTFPQKDNKNQTATQLSSIIKTKFNSKEAYSILLEKFRYYFVKIPTIKSNPEKEALIKTKINHNFSNDNPYESLIKWSFEHMYDFSKTVTLYLFEESLDIMILIKNGYLPNEIKKIIQEFEHYDIIIAYLSGIIEPDFLREITPNSSFSK